MTRRITFACALHEAKDIDRHPWVYASDPVDHGHGLMVAHCKKTCREPATCGCEEQTYRSNERVSDMLKDPDTRAAVVAEMAQAFAAAIAEETF